MKAIQVEKLLKGVLQNFIEVIKNDEIKEIFKKRCFITGGSIPSMLMDEWVNDYDFYFFQKDDINKVKEYFEKYHTKDTSNKYHLKLITDNSINISDKIQLITKFYGNPKEVTANFDWKHIKSYFWYNESHNNEKYELVLTDDVYRLIVEKELIYTGSSYPLSSLLRLKKYLKKGWTVSNLTMVTIILEVVQSFINMEKRRGTIVKPVTQKDVDNILIEEENVENEDEHLFNVEDVIYHLNGVDPLTIQAELSKKIGEHLTLKEIVKLIDR